MEADDGPPRLELDDDEALLVLGWWFHYIDVLAPSAEEIALRNRIGAFVVGLDPPKPPA